MTAEKNDPPFLVLQKYALSKERARAAVIAVMQRCDVQPPKEGWESLRLMWNHENPPVSVAFTDLVNEARQSGVVQRLHDYLDKTDSVFGGTLADFCTPNHQLRQTTEYAGWKKEAQGPCRASCVERELTEDILDYRRQACEHSNEYDFRLTARYFRGVPLGLRLDTRRLYQPPHPAGEARRILVPGVRPASK